MPRSNKLKIGLVIDDTLDTNDGVQQYVLALGAWLEAQDHEVHYLAGKTRERNLNNIHSLSRNVKVGFNKNRLSIPLPASRKRLKKLLRDYQFDILHVQTPYSPFLAGRLIRLAPKSTAIIGTFHILPINKLAYYGSRLLALYEWRTLKRFDYMAAVSPAAQAFAKTVFGLDSTVIPNVVTTAHFAGAQPLARNDSRQLTILFLGRLVPRKGCQTLLEAIADLVERNEKLPKFQVVICGAGPMMPGLIKYVNENGLSEIVKFTGYVSESEKPAYYAGSDIAVFPSSGGESFGIVLVEAMASGRSVVLGGDNEGYKSVLGPRPELLFHTNDPAGLADKLAEFLLSPDRRRAAAAWGGKRARDFDVSRLGPKILSIYRQKLLEKNEVG